MISQEQKNNNENFSFKELDDIAEKVLTEDFTLKKCPGKHIWYGEWENHRRIVIKLYKFYS